MKFCCGYNFTINCKKHLLTNLKDTSPLNNYFYNTSYKFLHSVQQFSVTIKHNYFLTTLLMVIQITNAFFI